MNGAKGSNEDARIRDRITCSHCLDRRGANGAQYRFVAHRQPRLQVQRPYAQVLVQRHLGRRGLPSHEEKLRPLQRMGVQYQSPASLHLYLERVVSETEKLAEAGRPSADNTGAMMCKRIVWCVPEAPRCAV